MRNHRNRAAKERVWIRYISLPGGSAMVSIDAVIPSSIPWQKDHRATQERVQTSFRRPDVNVSLPLDQWILCSTEPAAPRASGNLDQTKNWGFDCTRRWNRNAARSIRAGVPELWIAGLKSRVHAIFVSLDTCVKRTLKKWDCEGEIKVCVLRPAIEKGRSCLLLGLS